MVIEHSLDCGCPQPLSGDSSLLPGVGADVSENVSGRTTPPPAGRPVDEKAAAGCSQSKGLSLVLMWVCLLVSIATVAAEPFYLVEDILIGSTLQNSRDETWKPADGVALECTGLAAMDGDRLAVAIRKGEVWFLDGVYGDPNKIEYTRFVSGLDEPLGLMRKGDALLLTQRSEVTELRDRDGDGLADSYLTLGKGWNVSGAYHGYAYGPVEDRDGALWATLNLDMGDKTDNAKPWRGWGVRVRGDGTVEPMCAGMRSPCGLGKNAAGDMFFTDQQGNWIPTNSLHHLRAGAYYGNPEGLSEASLKGSPLKPLAAEVDGLSYPDAMAKLPQLVPPAVWFPYSKIGRSKTGITLDDSGGKFGLYSGQLFVGEFTNSAVDRVFLEKVDGQYQGACFPFMDGFASAVMTTAFGRDGSMFVGMSNRGWSSLGRASYGLSRVRWSGVVPFELLEMRARPDGFELVFTSAVDPATASDPTNYKMQSYTYPLHSRYGGDEILKGPVRVVAAELAEGGRGVRLRCEGLRELFVHELNYAGIRSKSGGEPWHDRVYYTLNRLPTAP